MAEKQQFFPMEKIIGQTIHDTDGQRFKIKGIDFDKEYIEIDMLEVDKKIKMSFSYFERWIEQVLQ